MHIPSLPMPTLPPNVGDIAPDIDLPATVGGARRLWSFGSSPVVVAFHDSHWDPARAEQVARYVALAARSCDDVALGDAILIRNDDAAAAQFAVRGTPAVFVIDARGAVAWRYVAGVDPLPSIAELGAVGAVDCEPQ